MAEPKGWATGFPGEPRWSTLQMPAESMPAHVQEFDWDFLLDYLLDPDERLVPVVGKELLRIPNDGGGIPLERHLACALLAALDLDLSLPETLY